MSPDLLRGNEFPVLSLHHDGLLRAGDHRQESNAGSSRRREPERTIDLVLQRDLEQVKAPVVRAWRAWPSDRESAGDAGAVSNILVEVAVVGVER